jgi:3-oxoadipate enol-lactonase
MLQNLSAHERARVLVSISDTRCDSDWVAENPGRFEELMRSFADDPFAEELGHQGGVRRMLDARRQHDTWERIAHIGCPVLTCGGLYDGIALPSSQKRMAGRIPGATLLMFQGGHQFLWQDSSAFPEIIRFLEE